MAEMRRADPKPVQKKCAGECKLQLTNIVKIGGPGWKVTGQTDPATTPNGADQNKANADLDKGIKEWAKPVALDPKCADDLCRCTKIKKINWDDYEKETRDFEHHFESGTDAFIAYCAVEFQVAIVQGACVEKKDLVIWV